MHRFVYLSKVRKYFFLFQVNFFSHIFLEKTELTLETFKEIENFMAPEVTAIVSDVAEYTSKKVAVAANNACNSSKYIYFNKQNLAYKSTVHLDNKKTGNLACSFIPLRCMADLKSATDNFRTSKEIIAKTLDDYWIACRCSNFREFYVVLQQKDANLIDINGKIFIREVYLTLMRL